MEQHLNDVVADVQRQVVEIEKAKKRFELEKELVAKAELTRTAIIHLNVGGRKFSTTRTTLISDSSSMLAAMFSGRHELVKDTDGNCFIDRNGKHFAIILDWLRCHRITGSLSAEEKEALIEEARYFQLDSLVAELEKSGGSQSGNRRVFWCQGRVDSGTRHKPKKNRFPSLCHYCEAAVWLGDAECSVCSTPNPKHEPGEDCSHERSFQEKTRFLIAKGWRPCSGPTGTGPFGVFMEQYQ